MHLLHVVVAEDRTWEEEVRLTSQLRRLLPAGGSVPVSTEVVFGREPAACIASAAERLDADVICVAARDKSSLDRLALGSVSRDVLEKTQRPVLVVRGDAEPSHVRV